MNPTRVRPPMTGVAFALVAAALFGASTPLAKFLLGEGVGPILLAGLLYLGSGCGLSLWWLARAQRGTSEASLARADLPWLAGAIAFGGVAGPVLLMLGLAATAASTASLLLNLESVFTALIAWFVVKESFDRRIALGMLAIVTGGAVLSWAWRPEAGVPWGPLAVAGACLCWAIDNNLTRRVSAADPIQIAATKGAVAGAVNTGIAFATGATMPDVPVILGAAGVGFVGYGVSLVCFVLALRHLGTARAGAYFSTAPFVGAAVSLLVFWEGLSWPLVAAGGLMGLGVWLHLTERHDHDHDHEEMTHDHAHVHDEHHQHVHGPDDPPGEPHTHPHHHPAIRHAHPHFPDLHHRHEH